MPDTPEFTTARSPQPVAALGYESRPLAALLDVFSIWSSGGFIRELARRADLSLDATSIVALTVLAREGNLRPSELAEHLRVGASAVSKLVRRLGNEGLAEQLRDPDDARAWRVRLTDTGHKRMSQLVDIGDEMTAALLADWSAADRELFATLLTRFRSNAQHYAATMLETTTDSAPAPAPAPASPSNKETS